jgi:hypothetical protein
MFTMVNIYRMCSLCQAKSLLCHYDLLICSLHKEKDSRIIILSLEEENEA